MPSGGDSSLSSGRVARKGASLSSFQDLVLVREFLKKNLKVPDNKQKKKVSQEWCKTLPGKNGTVPQMSNIS